MSQAEAYQQWCAHVSQIPSLRKFLSILPALSLRQRKALLTACRIQSYPSSDTRIYARLKSDWDTIVYYHEHPSESITTRRPAVATTLQDIASWISSLIVSPITSGLLSAAIRSAPVEDLSSYIEAKWGGAAKELTASIFQHTKIKLDFSVIMDSSPSARLRPFAPNLDPCPAVAQYIFTALTSLRSSLQNRLLLPKFSSKTVGSKVADEFWKMVPRSLYEDIQDMMPVSGGVTTQMLEKLYMETGIVIDGPVEVRTAWKYNDLRPRVYFAQGGDTFPISKFIQPIFNELADSLEFVHRKNRYFAPLSELSREDLMIIYDYSTFTSMLEEVVSFVDWLARFFQGTPVFILDGKRGPIQVDLGELLHDYNSQCNQYADFDFGKITDCLFGGEDFLFGHTCGMLGIPGNIQSCTVLHGIHLAFIAQSIYRFRCVGDDAKLYIRLEGIIAKQILLSQLRNIGEVAEEKLQDFEYDDEDDFETRAWYYTKRPIMRYQNRIISFPLMTFPTLDILLGIKESHRTTRITDLQSRQRRFCSIWNRLLILLHYEQVHLDESERSILYRFQVQAFRDLEITMKRPGIHKDLNLSVPLFLYPEQFGENVFQLFSEFYGYTEEVEVPQLRHYVEYPNGYVGEVWESGKTSIINYFERMRYIESELIYERVSRQLLGDQEFGRRMLSYNVTFQYRYTLVRSLPSWVFSLFH